MASPDFSNAPLLSSHAETASDGRPTLVLVRAFSHSPDRVWAAITEPDILVKWSPMVPDRNLSTTGSTTLTDRGEMAGTPIRVIAAEPPVRLEHTWGDDHLIWLIEPTPEGSRLTLRHTVEGPTWTPMVAAGWHICLEVAACNLDGTPIPRITGMAAMDHGWKSLHDRYRDLFGPNPA